MKVINCGSPHGTNLLDWTMHSTVNEKQADKACRNMSSVCNVSSEIIVPAVISCQFPSTDSRSTSEYQQFTSVISHISYQFTTVSLIFAEPILSEYFRMAVADPHGRHHFSFRGHRPSCSERWSSSAAGWPPWAAYLGGLSHLRSG